MLCYVAMQPPAGDKGPETESDNYSRAKPVLEIMSVQRAAKLDSMKTHIYFLDVASPPAAARTDSAENGDSDVEEFGKSPLVTDDLSSACALLYGNELQFTRQSSGYKGNKETIRSGFGCHRRWNLDDCKLLYCLRLNCYRA